MAISDMDYGTLGYCPRCGQKVLYVNWFTFPTTAWRVHSCDRPIVSYW